MRGQTDFRAMKIGANKIEIKEKIGPKYIKMVKFGSQIRPIEIKFISGSKCDRDKLNFSAERGDQCDRVGCTKGSPKKMGKCPKGINPEKVLYHLQIF